MPGTEPLEPPGDQAFRATSLHGRAAEMTYGGALSFLRRPYTRDLDGVDIVVSGVCFDVATSGRPGARFGPRAIRAASVGLAELPAYPWGFDPFDTLAVVDFGDCFLDWGHPAEVVSAVETHADGILASGATMLTLGGDHFITYPLLKAHAKLHGPLALVHFDAHPDTWDDDGARLDHGSMMLRAAREGLIDPAHSVQIGVRGTQNALGLDAISMNTPIVGFGCRATKSSLTSESGLNSGPMISGLQSTS